MLRRPPGPLVLSVLGFVGSSSWAPPSMASHFQRRSSVTLRTVLKLPSRLSAAPLRSYDGDHAFACGWIEGACCSNACQTTWG